MGEKLAQINYSNIDVTITQIGHAFYRSQNENYEYIKTNRSLFGLVYTISGSAVFDYGYKKVRTSEGNIAFLRKGDTYKITGVHSKGWKYMLIAFELTDDENGMSLPFKTVNSLGHTHRFYELFKDIIEMVNGYSGGHKVGAKGMLTQLIYEMICQTMKLIPGESSAYHGIKAAADYMEKNYVQKITVEQLADISGYSCSHFTKLFCKIYGTSPIQYLNNVRINHAKNLLKADEYGLAYVAEECGFSNIYYFSRIFKNLTGYSPKKY